MKFHFDNRFFREMPADPEIRNFRRQVYSACYSKVLPTSVSKPVLLAYSKEAAALLNLSDTDCNSEWFAQVFAGNQIISGMEPHAVCYGGHQFGQWAGQLGDGRAINLGEIINHQGERWVLQLKGAGETPYSRNADGLAVLRSSIREFLCSEAMYHLGIPTTRALSLIGTGETVVRDMFYNGNPVPEPGAVVCRLAPSFIRFGNFQIFAARKDWKLLKQLADYTIRTDFPELGEPSTAVYLQWFSEVCRRTAEMIAHWQRVGFVHGVMNTDNMSILGLTIDYGPYGWLENFDPGWTANTTDNASEPRYCFGNQPSIAYWNLGQLANAIYPLIEQVEPLEQALAGYQQTFESAWQRIQASKLGLDRFDSVNDDRLLSDLMTILRWVETDMSIFYRQLANVSMDVNLNDDLLLAPLMNAYYRPEQLSDQYKAHTANWLRAYIKRIAEAGIDDADRRKRMNAVNPCYVLRNYLAQLAIEQAEQGDVSMIAELLDILRRPYEEQPGKAFYAEKRPEWARHRAGCSMLSCSS